MADNNNLEIVSNEAYLEHEVAELICLKCLHRRITVYPVTTLLGDMECECGAVGFLVKTGQTLPESEAE